MKNHKLLLTGGVTLFAVFVLGQALPPLVPSKPIRSQYVAPQLEAWSFFFQGKNCSAALSRANIAASPEWTPSAPLPLTPAKAEEIARGELRKLVRDDLPWVVEEFNLRRCRGEAQGKWFYVVSLKPENEPMNGIVMPMDPTSKRWSERFVLPISFSGEPGQITTY